MDVFGFLSSRIGKILYKRDAAIWDFLSAPSTGKGGLSGVSILLSILEQNILLRAFTGEINNIRGDFNKSFPDPWHQANYKVIDHLRTHATGASIFDVMKLITLTINSERNWRKAKKTKNFAVVEKSFKALTAEIKKATRDKTSQFAAGTSPYSILVHERAPSIDLVKLSDELQVNIDFLSHLRERIKRRYDMSSQKRAELFIPLEDQEKLILSMVEDLGLKDKVKLGKASHAVCVGTNSNTSIVLHYHEDFIQTSLDFIHEIGHALARVYRLPKSAAHVEGAPVAGIHDSAIDECFALLWEDGIGRSTEWAVYLEKKMHDLNIDAGDFDAEKIHKQLTHLSRTPVDRGSADEIQYLYHIALRSKLAHAIINGNALEENNFPELWDKYHTEVFGEKSSRESLEECLQDFHWFAGQFGYFPSYAYGKFASCQIYEKLWKDQTIDFKGIAQGNFAPTINWLRENLYEFPYSTDINELLIHATGEPLNTQHFRNHLEHRYYEEDRPHVRVLKMLASILPSPKP